MENIIDPNDDFDFSQLSLGNPSGIQGGAYMTKLLYMDKPLYIQTPKSLTRQGFVKNPKKYYLELMFDNNDEKLFRWLENLEERCQKLIHEKGEAWFQNQLELNDIENAFATTIRPYKSCKYYLLRVNAKMNYTTNTPIVKIYNENQSVLTIEDVTAETNVISIVEIQGIKFTSRNFQIEMELKQLMTMNTEIFFDNCLIKTKYSVKKEMTLKEEDKSEKITEEKSGKIIEEEPVSCLEIEELKEFDIGGVAALESMTLKKPNQVYYEIYKEARKKAKHAKKEAILAFLEAKNIKKTYMLENLDESDSDSDMELDNISECSEEEDKI